MGDPQRLDAKCRNCGHVWTVLHLPAQVEAVAKVSKCICPKCHTAKPFMAGKGDLTTEDHLRNLIRRARAALPAVTDTQIATLRAEIDDLKLNMDADLNTMVRERQEIRQFRAEREKLVEALRVARNQFAFLKSQVWADDIDALLAELGETK